MQALMLWLSQFLYLSPDGATLLRVVAGVYFGYLSYKLIKVQPELLRRRLPIVGHMRSWMITVGMLATGLVALLLIVGYLTQLAAIVGAIIVAKLWWFNPDLDGLGFYSRSTCLLLLAICISLFMTGAGLYGFDLPLY